MCRAGRDTPLLPDVPAGALRRHATRSTRGCDPERADRRRPAPCGSGPAPPGLPRPRPRRADDRAGARAARHGVRRQRRHRGRRQGARRAVPPPASGPPRPPRTWTGSARSGYPRCGRPSTSTRARATSCSPAARCWPATASAPTRRVAAELADRVRAAGGEPAADRPALLPPGHRAVRARRRHAPCTTRPRSTTPGGRPLAELFPELIEAKDEDAEVLGLNAVSDGRHVVLPVQATGLAGQLPRARASSPSASTCPSCSRAAAAPSAARWNCGLTGGHHGRHR